LKTVGIIAEFNPFHNGHKYIIDQQKRLGNRVVCVIGDDFTQRGDVALISKYARAEAALLCGADLCILMPVSWSMSCAYNFALGGISLLHSLGNVDAVAFGSECGDVKKLIRVADAVHGDAITPILSSELKKGSTFAKARQNALYTLIGDDASVLDSPNDTLATEYISAAKSLGFNPEFIAIKRTGIDHDSEKTVDNFASASMIRKAVLEGDTNIISAYMPPESFDVLMREKEAGKLANVNNIESAILSYLRRLTREDIKALPEVGEGLENKIYDAVHNCTNLNDIFESIKSKRYTLARIRRIIFSAFLNLDTELFGQPVPYIKVLGFNSVGEEILKNASPSVPIINRKRDYIYLSGTAQKCFNIQNTASNLYAMAYNKPQPCDTELLASLIKVKNPLGE